MELTKFLTEKLEIENIIAIDKKEQKSISKFFLPIINFNGKRDGNDYYFQCRYANDETIFDLYLVDFIPFSESGIDELSFERYCIIYLCDFDIENNGIIEKEVTEKQFIFFNKTKEIRHIYIPKGFWKRHVDIDVKFETKFREPEYDKSNPESRFIMGHRSKGLFKKHSDNLPLISIIMPTYNCEKMIEQSIQSVIYQNYHNYELLIIDGLSKDKTLEIVKKYEKYIDGVLSEKDENIFDAINKGTFLSRGEYSVFLGSDDLLMPYSLENVVSLINDGLKTDYLFGDGIRLKKDMRKLYVNAFNKAPKYGDYSIMHICLYVRKNIFENLRGFNIKYHINADADFKLRLIKNKKTYKKIAKPIGLFREGGYSSFAKGKLFQMFKVYTNNRAINHKFFIGITKYILGIILYKISAKNI